MNVEYGITLCILFTETKVVRCETAEAQRSGTWQSQPAFLQLLSRRPTLACAGNCKTTMMCMISPALEAFPESLSTLKFANRAKNIRNVATVNEDVDQRTLLKKYERELRRLRQELAQRSKVRCASAAAVACGSRVVS